MAASSREARLFPVPLQNIVNVLRIVAQYGNGFTYTSEQPWNASVVVNLKHGMSFSSWGENIVITLTPQGNQTLVDILSECAMPTQIIDMGKNKENVYNLFVYIQQMTAYQQQGYPPQQGYQR